MAASILRFGRRAPLKCFQSENWILQRNPSVAWFCSHPPEPPKVPKTPAGKTVAPGERATLLAYRTAVVFPVKASESPGFPVHSAGAAAAGSDVAASAEPRADAPPTESTTSKPAGEAAEGSSSSSSDSDSDSDEELSPVKSQISEPTMKHESGDLKVTSEVTKPKYGGGSAPETVGLVGPEPVVCSVGPGGAAAEAGSGAVAEAEEPGHPPEGSEVTASPAGREHVSTAASPADASTDVPAGTKGSNCAGTLKELGAGAEAAEGAGAEAAEGAGAEGAGAAGAETAEGAGAEAAEGAGAEAAGAAGAEAAEGAGAEAAEVLEGSRTPVEAAVEPTKAGEGATRVPSPTESSEELMDAAPVIAGSVGEDLQPEGPSEEAAAAPPEPEEPLDPSTYKNYQHHSYHPFTFADMDVEMAKYRLPQPTANRH